MPQEQKKRGEINNIFIHIYIYLTLVYETLYDIIKKVQITLNFVY